MLCLLVYISNRFKISLQYALVLLSMPEHQRCWPFQSCSCTGVSGNCHSSEEPFQVVQLNGCTQIFLTGFLFMCRLSGDTTEHARWPWKCTESWDFSFLQEKFPWNNLDTNVGWLNLSLPCLLFLLVVFAGVYVCFDAEAAALGEIPWGQL